MDKHLVAVGKYGRPLELVNLGDGVVLNFNSDAFSCDLVIDLPVMKTHSQTGVSLGIKNLKGLIDQKSRKAWNGEPWDDVEILSGKMMRADPDKKHTILLGKCISQAHKNHPDFDRMHAIKGCPPKKDQIIKAFHEAGIMIDPNIIENHESLPGALMKYYENRPEFEPGHFKIK